MKYYEIGYFIKFIFDLLQIQEQYSTYEYRNNLYG